ncbi:MAG: precorrin-3B C(17)-methyltransferase [Oscillatoriaceae cyanobacterium]
MNDNFLGGEFTPLAAIATTPTAAKRLLPLCQTPGVTLWVSSSSREGLPNDPRIQFYSGSLRELMAELWPSHRAFIFCLATGATVRLIAPLLADKSRDPAVVVLDEAAQYVISLCSGHIGGADQLARLIAAETGATPILTGASNAIQLPGIDVLGVPFGWQRGPGDWTGVSGVIARGETVQVLQEVGTTLWQQYLPPNHPFQIGFAEYIDSYQEENAASVKARIWISYQTRRFAPNSEIPKVQWHPRVLWVGIGCDRGVSAQLIETAIMRVFQAYHLALEAVAGIATIDIKASEDGLVELCADRHWPLQTFPSEDLRQVTVPTPSTVVETEVGTPSVAEAAAKLAANAPSLLVAKKIYREEGEPGAVTVAVAVAEREYTGRRGKLLLVGTPGNVAQITAAAQRAIVSADAIIGYTLYTNLISSLLHPGQIIESRVINQEKQIAERAIELSTWGLTVAVIYSDDAGIYGIAGLVLEQLRSQNWDGQTPAVQVFPAITAIQAAAARVGAPLMYDFCAIILSDLLTPWPVIEKRLQAAAIADFITGIYNHSSPNFTEQIVKTREIFLKHRSGNTPVAIVRDAFQEDEQITLTNLDNMLDMPIDMLSIVIIGNQSTEIYGNWMIIPI